ncbi:MAG: citrate/2-methylcitrate synthase [Thermoprotei archaeon]
MDKLYKTSEESWNSFQKDFRVSWGLEDVYIKPTSLTYIDGEKGELRYLGYGIQDIISANALAEEMQYAFINGELPSREELRHFVDVIEEGYDLPEHVIAAITSLPSSSDVVAMQASAMASLAAVSDFSWPQENKGDFFARMLGQMSAITAVSIRHSVRQKPRLPSPGKAYAESFLEALLGKSPGDEKVRAMNNSLILYMDHEVPASTTAGIVTASTLADPYSAVLSALAALRGPLHGGATEVAMSQFLEISDPRSVDAWIQDNIITGKRRLMGFGHRVYKTYDPRALIFKSMAVKLASDKSNAKLLSIALRLEEAGSQALQKKGIYPNADFYSPIVFSCIGIPFVKGSYTAVFALSRLPGWLAHFNEYLSLGGRIIRPRAIYVGHNERRFKPISER